MHAESDASRETFEAGQAAIEQDSSSEEEEEEDDGLEVNFDPYKRFKTEDGSARQSQRKAYGAQAMKEERLESSLSCQRMLILLESLIREQSSLIEQLDER